MNSSLMSANSPMRVLCPVYPHMHLHLPVQVSPPQNTGDAKTHGPATCSAIPQGQGLGLAPGSFPAHKSLLTNCQLLKAYCKQYQKAEEKGLANITSITAVTTTALSIHTSALSTFSWCAKCVYSHPLTNVPFWGKSAIHVAATIITPLCANAKRCRDHPVTTEA